MSITEYQLGATRVRADSHQLAASLEAAYDSKAKPTCLCQKTPIPMYLARYADGILIKRMPGTAGAHAPGCEHYELPAAVSGLGEMKGKAIQEKEDGIHLKLDFSLSKTGKRQEPAKNAETKDTVKSEGSKLSLSSLLHYLWDEADLNTWWPHFSGRRNYTAVRNHLLAAAAQKHAKNMALIERLYIPEPYREDNTAAAEKRRAVFVNHFKPSPESKKRDFVVYIGELKAIEQARFGQKLVIKNARSFPIYVEDQTIAKFRTRFQSELALWQANERYHLMIIATCSITEAASASLEEIGVMLVNDQWLPVENVDEMELMKTLVQSKRSFIRCMRYNAKDRPMPTVLLTDTTPHTACYIMPDNAEDDYQDVIDKLSKSAGATSWLWLASESELPPLPAPNLNAA